MTLTPAFLTLYTGAVVAVSFAATLFLLRERLTMVEEARLILDRVDGDTGRDGQWWAADDPDRAQAARRRAAVAFWRRALHRRRPGGSRWRSTGPAGDPAPAHPAQGSAAVPSLRRPEADPEVTAYLDAVPPYPAVDYHGRHTATGAYPQVPSTRQAYP